MRSRSPLTVAAPPSVPRLTWGCLCLLLLAGTSSGQCADDVPPTASARPLRSFVLVTGERFSGELLRADRTAVEFRWHGHTRFRLPMAAVAAIENPPGVADVLDEGFPLNSATATAWTVAVDQPVARGFAQLWRDETDADLPDAAVTWRLSFDDRTLLLTLRGDGSVQCVAPDDWPVTLRQAVHWPTGRVPVAVRWTKSDWDIRVGSALWRRGGKPPGELTRLVLSTEAAATPVRVRDLTVRRFDELIATSFQTELPPNLDALLRTDGDVWFGEFLRATDEGIELRGPHDAVALVPWSDFAALRLRPRHDGPALLRPVTGRVAEFVGPSLWEPWRLERERWLAAEVSPWIATTFGAPIVLEHPLLGRFTVSQRDIARRVLAHPSMWHWLHPGPVHLGNNIEPTWRQPRPQGTRLTGTFSLPVAPTTPVGLSLDAVGLEPCGPGTPPTQPFLAELHAGGLRTELLINGEVIGDWNRLLTHTPRPEQPVRLRLPIPVEHLQPGVNHWEIRQHPLRNDPYEFDDCELGGLALEIE